MVSTVTSDPPLHVFKPFNLVDPSPPSSRQPSCPSPHCYPSVLCSPSTFMSHEFYCPSPPPCWSTPTVPLLVSRLRNHTHYCVNTHKPKRATKPIREWAAFVFLSLGHLTRIFSLSIHYCANIFDSVHGWIKFHYTCVPNSWSSGISLSSFTGVLWVLHTSCFGWKPVVLACWQAIQGRADILLSMLWPKTGQQASFTDVCHFNF